MNPERQSHLCGIIIDSIFKLSWSLDDDITQISVHKLVASQITDSKELEYISSILSQFYSRYESFVKEVHRGSLRDALSEVHRNIVEV